MRIAVSTSLMILDCSGVTTENSATCVFFFIEYGDSVVLVIRTAVFLSIIVEIEWDISRLAASVNFPTGVTVPVVCHSDGRWVVNKCCNRICCHRWYCCVVLNKTGWGLALASVAAFLACIVRCGKWIRPCVVSMTTLLCLMKCNPIMDKIFITTECSAKVLSPMSNLSVAVDMGFSNWPFATWV